MIKSIVKGCVIFLVTCLLLLGLAWMGWMPDQIGKGIRDATTSALKHQPFVGIKKLVTKMVPRMSRKAKRKAITIQENQKSSPRAVPSISATADENPPQEHITDEEKQKLEEIIIEE